MKGESRTFFELTMYLKEDEARWLRNYLQNPHYDDESEHDRNMRKKFFEFLNRKLS